MGNTTPFDSPPLQGAWKKTPGRNPVIDNLTTIQKLNQRITDLEFSNERLYEALEKMYDCMNTEGALEGARDALRLHRMVRVHG